jgi:predicted RNA-binding Zn ribbon-like protein
VIIRASVSSVRAGSVTGLTGDTVAEDRVTGQDGDVHVFVSGDPALDFIGTLKWRRSAEPKELLGDPAALDRWFVESGTLTGAPASSGDDLRAARELRESVYRLVSAALGGGPARTEDVAAVNRAAAARPVTTALVDGRREASGTPAQALSSIARAAIEVVAHADPAELKECGRPACTRVYLDRSHGHRRAWCGMQECGNRVKAAAYRERRRARAGA